MTKTVTSSRSLKSAAYWFVELQEQPVSEQTRLNFELWLQQPEHQAAWQKVLQMHQTFEQFQAQQQQHPDLDKLLQQPLISRRTALKCLAVFGTSFFSYQAVRTSWSKSQWYVLMADHAVGVGHFQQISLQQKGQLWLNSNSAIDTSETSGQTAIDVLQGEIFVQYDGRLAQDSLLLRSKLLQQQITITSRKCELNLYSSDQRCSISLYQGEAQVSVNGQQVLLTSSMQLHITSEDIHYDELQSSLPAWREGKLIAKAMPLEQFCAELNRYRRGIITVKAEAASLRIDGIFPVFSPDTALDMMANSLPVKIDHFGPWWVQVSLA
ncbi:DUF4880 domain-containing protein [Rheinheimera aquimaris]|uniref:DUF4880 domain-containing protein n=1 Tax=Rheinheimera aquimaris TaxID=412437 RepID=UPI0010670385|nr:DUF4880 domain-containing protein [Rheinheimera aquimaris]MCD1598542.1 DUF4880 domain-containing protein [Rheinheimera aquimaris]